MSLDEGSGQHGRGPGDEPAAAVPEVDRAAALRTVAPAVAVFVGMAVVVVGLLVQPLAAVVVLLVPPTILWLQRSRRDAVTALTLFMLLLFLIPPNLVLGPLGAAGRPAPVFGLLCGWWWAHDRLLPGSEAARGVQPVRWAAEVLGLAAVASYVAAFARPIDGTETLAADRGVLGLFGLLGVILLTADGVRDRGRLDVLLRRMVAAGTVVAVIGILQFAGIDVSGAFQVPGLSEQTTFQEVQDRSGLRRVASTATHPIEFGVVLALIFPFALHYATNAKVFRRAAWIPVGFIALAIPLSVSRSGTLAVAITFGAMWLTWDGRRRVVSALLGMVLIVAMRLAVPGLIGTIRSLFTSIGNDDSVAGRTDDYAVVGKYMADRPILGRGLGTFIPDRYVLLDNQYLGSLIEMGFIGTAALLGLFAAGFATARGARRGADPETRSLSQALAGAVLAGVVAAGTFDLLSFVMAAGVLSLCIGCAGALWRMQAGPRASTQARPPGEEGGRDGTLVGGGAGVDVTPADPGRSNGSR